VRTLKPRKRREKGETMADRDDALSEVLRLVRLRACVYFARNMEPGWGMTIPASPTGPLHMVLEGQCLLRIGTQERRLRAGDAVLLPRGTPHQMLDNADAMPVPGPEAVRNLLARPEPANAVARMLCGHFEWDGTLDHPLFAELPRFILVRNMLNREGGALFSTVVDLITAEQASAAPGASAVTDRMGEVLFVSLLRAWIADHAPTHGVLATMSDPRLARALSVIHQQHGSDLDLIQLARAAGMSRTAFATRFHEVMGRPPKAYLTEWRLLQARQLLTRSDIAQPEIIERVGYGSEAGFARAFKRRFGETPAQLRRAARAA